VRALAFDSRGSEDSEKTAGAKSFRLDLDVTAAAKRLRADGARRSAWQAPPSELTLRLPQRSR